MLKKLVTFIFVVALISAGGVYWGYQQALSFISQPVILSKAELITVKPGMHLRKKLNQLYQDEKIQGVEWARFVPYLAPELAHLKVGTYWVEPGISLRELLAQLNSGQEHQFAITFVEGSRFTDWQIELQEAPEIKHILADKSESEIAELLGIEREKLEGLFLPETYHYTAGTTDLAILRRAHQDLQDIVNASWEKRDAKLPLTSPYEALTLASIIEKETGVGAERERIASVFVNRLNKRMRLQTDPTVIYGMGESYDGNIRKKDLRAPTPYNTYVIWGLPPTPIAMAGKAAIEAALNPDGSDYLYFVATGTGGHTFSKTLVQHNRAVRAYLRTLKK